MFTTEIVLHVDHYGDDDVPGVGVVARVDRAVDAFPIVRLYVGESLALTMSPAMAERIIDALVEAEAVAADPPAVSHG